MSKNLFQKKGEGFYEELRIGTHSKSFEIKNFINTKYEYNKEYLDADFPNRLRYEFESRLWELTICDYLRTNNSIYLLSRALYAVKNISFPDFCFIFDKKRFFIECVTVSSGSCKELSIPFKESLGIAHRSPREEYKERFCQAIDSKIIKYKEKYHKVMSELDGFIIAVSSGKIGQHIHPNDPFLELSCLHGLSERMYNAISGAILFIRSDKFNKKSNGSSSTIKTDYFVNDQYSYLTAVLYSRNLAVCFSGSELDLYGIPSPSTEFILSHSPNSKNKLDNSVFPVQKEYRDILKDNIAFS